MRKNGIPVLGALALSMGMMGGCSGNRSATDTTAIQETASVQEPGIMVIRQIRWKDIDCCAFVAPGLL